MDKQQALADFYRLMEIAARNNGTEIAVLACSLAQSIIKIYQLTEEEIQFGKTV